MRAPGAGGGDDPGKAEESLRKRCVVAGEGVPRPGVEVVQPGALRGGDELPVVGAGVADGVPAHAGLRVIPVGGDLHGGARSVLVEPADGPHELLLPPVAEQLELVRLAGVDAEFRLLPGADAPGPGVSQQAVGEQPELEGPPFGDGDIHPFRSVALPGDGNPVAPRVDPGMHGP